MQANSPSAFFLSLTLHGLAVALIFFFAIIAQKHVKESPKVFELVAGEGDNYAANEAPALGDPNPVKFELPKMPAPVIRPAPPEPLVQPLPDPPKVIQTEPKPRVVEKKPEPKPVVKPKSKKKPEPLKTKPMSKEEFDRLYGKQRNPAAKAPPAPKVKKIDTKGISKGVIGGSVKNLTGGAGGRALTRAQQNLLDSYIALLLQRLRAAHQKPPGLSDLLHAKVSFRVGSDGTLSGVKIVSSSGSAAFDQSVLEAFRRVRSIGPTPDGKSDVWEVTFRMKEEG